MKTSVVESITNKYKTSLLTNQKNQKNEQRKFRKDEPNATIGHAPCLQDLH
jgi:hypothetical protein